MLICGPLLYSAELLISASRKRTSNLLLFVFSVLNTSGVDDGLVGENETVLLEVPVARPQNGVQHALVQKEVTHPLGDDDVDLWEWQLNLLHLTLQKSDLVLHTVDLDNLLCLFDDGRVVYCDDVLCAGLDGEPERIATLGFGDLGGVRLVSLREWASVHAENGCTASDVQDDLVLEKVLVLVDRIAV